MRVSKELTVILLFLFVCLGMHAEANQSKRAGTPEDSVFIFGCVINGNLIRYTQMDPAFEPAYYQRNSGPFFFENVEPGSYLKVTTFVHNGHSEFTTYYIGFSGRTPLDIRVPTKPGLYYLGYLEFSEMKKNELIFVPFVHKTCNERELLQYLLPRVKNKAWVPVIESRIKELEDEGK